MTAAPSLRAVVTFTVACAALIATPAAAYGGHLAASTRPLPRPTHTRPAAGPAWPGPEGPAGPPARLPNGQLPRPPAITGPQIATSCPAPGYGPRYYAPGTGRTVALTFDDGPGRSTWRILQVLRKYRIPATFFNNGGNEAVHKDLTRAENRYGFVLGNHTWNHPDMRKLSATAQATQMDRTSAEQYRITHTRPCVFRPPFGSYNSTTLRLAQNRRMKFWIWSVDPEDWKAAGSDSAYWVNRIISITERQGGALTHPVVLLHNQITGNPATVRALPTIIRFFQHHGYHFVRL